MREMKDSGIEWIGEMPKDWDILRLKACFSTRDGGAWGDEPSGENDIICLRIADFDYSRLAFKDISTNKLTKRHYEQKQIERLALKKDDLLIEKSGGGEKVPVGRTVIFDKEYKALYANFMDRLRCREFINPKYLLYIMSSFYQNGYVWNYIKQTTGIQNLDLTSMLSKESIPYPDYEIQEKIAFYLDSKCSKIDDIIEKQQSVIEKLKAYKQSIITEAVTKGLNPNVPMKDSGVEWIGEVPEHWRIPKIKYIANISSGSTPDRSRQQYWNGNINWFKTGELQNNRLYSSEEKITELALDETAVKLYPKNTILIAMYGQGKTRGMTALLECEATSNQACSGIIVKKQIITTEFLWKFLIGSYQAIREEALGSGQPNLSGTLISNFHVAVPSIKEQDEICLYIDQKCSAIDSTIANKQSLIEKLTAYKKSLIYEVVTGKKEV